MAVQENTYFTKPVRRYKMRKMILESDSIVIDGVELTYDEIKCAVVESHKFHKLSDFLENTFHKEGVVNE